MAQWATSPAARTSPADTCRPYADSAPTTRPSTTSGTTTALRIGQPTSSHSTASAGTTQGRPACIASLACSTACAACRLPGPSQASSTPSPTTASAGVPSRARRCRAARRADSGVSPSRSGGAASEAACRVAKAARSAGVPKPLRPRTSQNSTAEAPAITNVTDTTVITEPMARIMTTPGGGRQPRGPGDYLGPGDSASSEGVVRAVVVEQRTVVGTGSGPGDAADDDPVVARGYQVLQGDQQPVHHPVQQRFTAR